MKMRHGLAFPDADEFMVNELEPDGTYQADHYRTALQFVTDRRRAVDAGAHIGTWTLLMAEDFGRVIAVEPSTDTFDALRLNTEKLWNVERRRVALGDRSQRGRMHLKDVDIQRKNTGGRFFAPDPTGNVPVETIDSWNLPSLGFLKLDVEGSEVAALRGARETLCQHRPIVLYEDKNLWRRYGEHRDAPERFLLSIGYQPITRVSKDWIWGPGPR